MSNLLNNVHQTAPGTTDGSILGAVLRRYEHLFYGLESEELGSISQVERSIETGDARTRKENPCRIPYALKPVVDEHIDEMLRKGIIEPSTPLE